MSAAIPPPPPRPDEYIVVGGDGKQYPFTLANLRRSYAEGSITAPYQVYSHARGEWQLVGELPELRDVFPGRAQRGAGSEKKISACGGCLLIFLVLIVIGALMNGSGSRTSERSSETTAPVVDAAPVAQQPLTADPDVQPAIRRVRAAEQLQSIFDGSLIKGFELKFVPRGRRCDVLYVEGYSTLEPSMMTALAHGTLIYGRVLPGGVNKFAFDAGFRDVVYSNVADSRYRAFGESNLSRKQARSARRCTEKIAAKIGSGTEWPVTRPETPKFENLSWRTADVGRRVYSGAFQHEVTIVSVDPGSGLNEVRYAESGRTEAEGAGRLRRIGA